MTVLKPRSKLVYFRVSEDEYRRLNDLCQEAGARSLSDLVREALLGSKPGQSLDGGGLETLARRIERLTRLVEDLGRKLEEKEPVKTGSGV